MLENTRNAVYMKHVAVLPQTKGIHTMPVSNPPRKRYTPRYRKTSTKGAWDQVREMVQQARQLMALVPANTSLLLGRKQLPGFDEPKAIALLQVLHKDTAAFKATLDDIEKSLGDNRGDIREDDTDALVLTLQIGTRIQDWTDQWNTVVMPQLEEINKLLEV